MNLAPGPLNVPPQGCSARGIYLANLWYGHQATLLKYLNLCQGALLPGKIQIGWQPGTGLEAEQGMQLEIAHYRLPFYVWGKRHLAACRADGLGWGLAIGAPALYRPSFQAAIAARRSASGNVALAFPSHSSNPYWIEEGWREWAHDLRFWAESRGLTPVACLHAADYARGARLAVEAEDVPTTCVGHIFWPEYLDRVVALITDAVVVVTDRVCTPTFYAAALGRSAIVRGPKLVPSLARDEWCGVEFDHEALAREFPWTVTGTDGRDAALCELGADRVRPPYELRAAIFGETNQVAWWRFHPDAESYAASPTVNDTTNRANVLRQIIAPIMAEIGSVLETGCGSGANLTALREILPDARIWGVEPGHKARALACAAGHEVDDGMLPRVCTDDVPSDDSVADLVMTAGVLIHAVPELRAPCVAEMARLSKRYLLLIEYGAESPTWNGHVGKDDFGAILRACRCRVIEHGPVPAGSQLGTHYWLADVGEKRMPL